VATSLTMMVQEKSVEKCLADLHAGGGW